MEARHPERPSHFDRAFLRLLTESRAVNQIGADGFLLLTEVVQQEDQIRYAGPVDFWNGQLMLATGISSEDTLARVRKRCVDAGWLLYIPGSRSRPARYRVQVPDANPVRTPRELPQVCGSSELNTARTPHEHPQPCGTSTTNSARTTAGLPPNVRSMCGTSLPVPSPSPEEVPDGTRAAANVAGRKKRPKSPPPSRSRTPDLLFEAIREVTGTDAVVDGSFIGAVVSRFKQATPPIAPNEVRDFAAHWREALPWAKPDDHPRLTIGIVEKHMTTFRGWRKDRPPLAPASDRERRRSDLLALVKNESLTLAEAESRFGGPLA